MKEKEHNYLTEKTVETVKGESVLSSLDMNSIIVFFPSTLYKNVISNGN